MSLLSRLRGSKGYGACRDAASPRADQAGPKPRAISASMQKGKATLVAFPFEQKKSSSDTIGDVIYINFRAAVGTRPFFQCIGGDRGR